MPERQNPDLGKTMRIKPDSRADQSGRTDKADKSPIPGVVLSAIRDTSQAEIDIMVGSLGSSPEEQPLAQSSSPEKYPHIIVPAVVTFLNGRRDQANTLDHPVLLEGEIATVGTSHENTIVISDPSYKDGLADVHFEIQIQREGLYVRAVNGAVSVEDTAAGTKKSVRREHDWQKFETGEKLSPVFRTKSGLLRQAGKLYFCVDTDATVPVQRIREMLINRLAIHRADKAEMIVKMLEEPSREKRVEIRQQLILLETKISAAVKMATAYRINLFQSQSAADEEELICLSQATEYINKGLRPCLDDLKLKLHEYIEKNYKDPSAIVDEYRVESLAEADPAFKETLSRMEDYADATSTFGIPVIIGKDTRLSVEQLKNAIYFEIQQKLDVFRARHVAETADKEERRKNKMEGMSAVKQKHREILSALNNAGFAKIHCGDDELLEDETMELECEGVGIVSALEDEVSEINFFEEMTIGDHPSNTLVLPKIGKGDLRTAPFMARIGWDGQAGSYGLTWIEGPFEIAGRRSIDEKSLVFNINQGEPFRLGPYTLTLGKHGYTKKALQEQKAEKYAEKAIELARGVFSADLSSAESSIRKIRMLTAKGLITDSIVEGLGYGAGLIVEKLLAREKAASDADYEIMVSVDSQRGNFNDRLKDAVKKEIFTNAMATDTHLFETLRLLGKSGLLPRDVKRQLPDEKALKSLAAQRVSHYCGLINKKKEPQSEARSLVSAVKNWFSADPEKSPEQKTAAEPANIPETEDPEIGMAIIHIVRFIEMGLSDMDGNPIAKLDTASGREIATVKRLRELVVNIKAGGFDKNVVNEALLLARDKKVADIFGNGEIAAWNRAHGTAISAFAGMREFLRAAGAGAGRQILRAALEKNDPRREIVAILSLIDNKTGLIGKDDLACGPELILQRVDVLLKSIIENAKRMEISEENEKRRLESETKLLQDDAERLTARKIEMDSEMSGLRDIAVRIARAAWEARANMNMNSLLKAADLITETTDRLMMDREVRLIEDRKAPNRKGEMVGVERSWRDIKADFYTTSCELGRKLAREVMEGRNMNSNILMLKMALKKNLFAMSFLGDDAHGNPLTMKTLEAVAAEKTAMAERARVAAEQARIAADRLRKEKFAEKYRELFAKSNNDNPADFKYVSLINLAEIKNAEEAAIAQAVMDEIGARKINALISAIKAGTATPGMNMGGKIILRKGFNPAVYSFNPADIALIK